MTEAERRPLNRRRVLEAALELVDREGLGTLSMRKLGRELGVEAMSLYNHVPNKGALLDGIVELLLEEVDIPPPGSEDWEARWREVARSSRRMAHAHPRAFPLVATRPLNTPGALRQLNAALEILRAAGFDPETSYRAFMASASYSNGFVLDEITRQELRPDSSHLDVRGLPRLAELEEYAASRDTDAEFEFGLDLILAGLRRLLDTRPAIP